jgi:hypothetical protein
MLGQPIGKEGDLLGQFLGTIARNDSYYLLENNVETIIQFI